MRHHCINCDFSTKLMAEEVNFLHLLLPLFSLCFLYEQ